MIDRLLAVAVERHPERPALGDISFRDFAALVDGLAVRIRYAAGPGVTGQRVALIAPNSPLLCAGLFAAWRLGAVAVPLNARLREHELRQTLTDAEPLVVVSVPKNLGYSFTALLPGLLPELPSVRSLLFADALGEVEIDAPVLAPAKPPAPLPSDVAALLYTSGTTGVPKGALATHERERNGAARLAEVLGLTPEDSVGFIVPVSHAYGLTTYLAAIAAGARAVLVESTTTLAPLLSALDQRDVTVLHGSPSLFTSLLKARPEGLPGVRTGFVAGAASPRELLERLEATGAGVLNLYGLTETGAVCSCRHDDPREARVTTVGRPLPGYEVRVDGGELQVRGPYVTRGYFRRPEESAAAFSDGWFRTGDLAEIDEDGYVRVAGRAKELVHVGGFNVFPAEVETVLLAHPDVSQAAVVGAPHERMGEVLRAFVVPRPGAEVSPATLLAFARTKIAGYKLPYELSVVPELPLLPSGKPDRRALAAFEPAVTS